LDFPTAWFYPFTYIYVFLIFFDLSVKDDVTIFVSTHFMNEAMRCDRISLMNAGKVLVIDTPQNIIAMRHAGDLEEAFIEFLEDATGEKLGQKAEWSAPPKAAEEHKTHTTGGWFSPRRMGAYMMRETLELRRDYLRLDGLVRQRHPVVHHGLRINLDVDNPASAPRLRPDDC
jgi:ribosome-dependent ATPase